MLDSADFVVNTDYADGSVPRRVTSRRTASSSPRRPTALDRGVSRRLQRGRVQHVRAAVRRDGRAAQHRRSPPGTNAFAFIDDADSAGRDARARRVGQQHRSRSGTSTTPTSADARRRVPRARPSGDRSAGAARWSRPTRPISSPPRRCSNGNFAVTWQVSARRACDPRRDRRSPTARRSARPSRCSTTVGAVGRPHRSHVAANGADVLYAWIVDGDVRVRARHATRHARPAPTRR